MYQQECASTEIDWVAQPKWPSYMILHKTWWPGPNRRGLYDFGVNINQRPTLVSLYILCNLHSGYVGYIHCDQKGGAILALCAAGMSGEANDKIAGFVEIQTIKQTCILGTYH